MKNGFKMAKSMRSGVTFDIDRYLFTGVSFHLLKDYNQCFYHRCHHAYVSIGDQ